MMMAPSSIHDPITPEQACGLPAFFWNVRPELGDAYQLARKEKERAQNRDRHERAKRRAADRREVQLASSGADGQAAEAIAAARMVDPHERLVHKARPSGARKGRMA